MRSKGHVYVVAESMYSDRPRIPMNPYIMKAHPSVRARSAKGAMGRSYTSSGALVPWCTHREESTRSWNPANDGAFFSLSLGARMKR